MIIDIKILMWYNININFKGGVMLVLITGKSGSGKTYIANKLAPMLNAEIISIDKLSHKILENDKVINEIKTQFGSDFIENKVINRKKLGKIVFSDKSKLEILNNIVQPKIEAEIDKITQNKAKIYILDYLLLPKMKYFNLADLRILITANNHIRKTRIIKRDNISEQYYLAREENSIDFNAELFDIIIENNDNINLDKITQQIKEKLCLEKQ